MLEFSEEEYASLCSTVADDGCSNPTAFTDEVGNTWCADCQHRGEFINWGKARSFPAMEIHPYAMAQGAYYWQVTATQGDEDRVWSFLSLIEMLDATTEVA